MELHRPLPPYRLHRWPGPPSPHSLSPEVDHRSEDCAIAPTLAPTKTPSFQELDRSQSFRSGKHSFPSFQGTPGPPQKRICMSWNKGKCSFPGASMIALASIHCICSYSDSMCTHVTCCFTMVLICLHACISAWVASLPIEHALARGCCLPCTYTLYAGYI